MKQKTGFMEAINYNILDGLNNDLLEVISKNTIITITDALGRIEYANNNYCKIMECDVSKLIGETHELLKSHLHANKVYKELWKTIKAGHKWQGVLNDISDTGKLFWLDTTIVPIINEEENRIKYVAIYKDVTKYELENTQLLESKIAYSKYMSIYQSIDVGIIVVTDNVGNITEWNKGAEVAFGYSKAEILGHPLSVLLSIKYRKGNIKELLAIISKIKESQNTDIIELCCIRKNGSEFPVEFTLNSLSLDNSNFYCASMLDITKCKELGNKLKLKTKVLELFLKQSKQDEDSVSEDFPDLLNNEEVITHEKEIADLEFANRTTNIDKRHTPFSSNNPELGIYNYKRKDINLDIISK